VADFDSKAYLDQVLKPLRRRRSNLPDDLMTRYAIDLGMDAAALRERVGAVVSLWSTLSRRASADGQLCKSLLSKHDELKAQNDLASPAFWKQWQAARSTQLGSKITDLAAQLTASHGELGVITPGQLRAAAAGHDTLGDAEVDQARAAAKLRLVEPLTLPTEPGMRGRFGGLDENLVGAGARSIPELLFPGLTEFGLLGGFTVSPQPAGRTATLSAASAKERADELSKVAASQTVRSAVEAIGLLATEATAGTDLTALALFHLLKEVRANRADGVGPRPLFARLRSVKLRQADAGHIAVSLLAETTVQRDPAAEVHDLLAEGRLLAAQQLVTTVSGTPGDAARESVARQRQQVDRLRGEAATALRDGREELAAARLREALALGNDVPGLAEELAALPAAPVVGATAGADGGGVRIAWRPAPSHGDATVYRVVRSEGRDPVDATDGQEIPVRRGAGHSIADVTPPVGRRLHYAVFAHAPGGRLSRPVCVVVQVVPPVTDVVVEGGNKVVTGRWSVHPDVVAVEVSRSTGTEDGPGTSVAVTRDRGFRDETVVDGTQYFYSVVACYRSPSGGATLRSTPVVQLGAARLEARPVTTLTAVPATSAEIASGAGLAVRVSWRQRPGTVIVIRRATQPCPWEYGEWVSQAQMDGYGAELDGRSITRGESTTLVAPVPSGRSIFVPFTIDTGGGVRGQDAVLDLTTPLQRVHAQRFGDEIRVTWVWPEGVSAADVRWAGGHRRISVQQFRDEGGCRLGGVPKVRRVDVSAVVLGLGSDESQAAAISVEVDERPPELRYELRRRGNHLIGGVTCTVTVTGAEPVTGATLIVIAAPGAVMPRTPDAGMELARQPVVLGPLELPMVVEAAVPKLRKPYWLRCFLAEPAPALLIDPPVSQLKVS
jgi:hypothetical protein